MELDRLNRVIKDIKDFYLDRDPEGPAKIEKVITQIKDVYSCSWEKDHLPYIKKFCGRVSQGIPVASLSLCGRAMHRTEYNKYISYFLDPASQHGLGDKLLKAIISSTGDDLGCVDLSGSTVETEKWMVGYTCDISIIGKDYCIFIEQKLLNPENINKDTELNRLRRYNAVISSKQEFKNAKIIKIYLTSAVRVPEAVEGWHVITVNSIMELGIKLCEDNTLSRTARENLMRFLLNLLPGPYYETEDIIRNMLDTGNYLINNGFDYSKALQLDRLLKENKFLVRLLMEG